MRPTVTILYCMAAASLAAAGCADRGTPTSPPPIREAAFDRASTNATFTSFSVPGATVTLPLDINDHGVIVGRYAAAGRTHGFMRDESGTYTTIDFPGSSFTVAASVNDSGAVVGWYSLPATPAVRHGFLFKDGAFTTIDPPGSTFTNALGINERGDVSGRYCTHAVCLAPGSGSFHGFVYHDGAFTTVDVAGASETDAFKFAANGTLVGGFTPVGGPEQLFLFAHDAFSTFPLPNGKSATLDNGGINARGDVVGTYCDALFPCLVGPTATHGFLISRGEFTTIDYPGAAATAANGINARGDIVGGWADVNAVERGFLRVSR